jgi:hypothetical protein
MLVQNLVWADFEWAYLKRRREKNIIHLKQQKIKLSQQGFVDKVLLEEGS